MRGTRRHNSVGEAPRLAQRRPNPLTPLWGRRDCKGLPLPSIAPRHDMAQAGERWEVEDEYQGSLCRRPVEVPALGGHGLPRIEIEDGIPLRLFQVDGVQR